MKTKNLVMISFVENKLRRKVMVRYTYDDNVNQKVIMENKIIPLHRKDSYKNLIQKVYPGMFTETKLVGVTTLINKPVFDRLVCNLEHMA